MPLIIDAGNVSVSGGKITDLADGVNPGDAVNKSQLDALTVGGGTSASALSTRWEILTDGDEDDPQFLFDGGDALYVEVAN